MIMPSFNLTATERVLPKLSLDFTTASLDPRITFTRSGNTATRINASGAIEVINANLPRFDYDPTTLVCKGLLIEESRTNSLLNTDLLSTQVVVVAATARTLSFYGTGQIVLSGAASATVTGTGAYPTRTTYTFTPTAGALTLTVTGTVQYAQLEAGAFATSYIPTTTTALTRNADVANMTGTNFSSWYNQNEGTFVTQYAVSANGTAVSLYNANGSIRMDNSSGSSRLIVESPIGTYPVVLTAASITAGTFMKTAFSYKIDSFALSQNGVSVLTDTSGSFPTNFTALNIGRLGSGSIGQMTGYVKSVYYYPQRLTNAENQAFSK